MSAGTIVAIVIVVIIVAAVIAAVSLASRRRRLQQRFGPEYDRMVESSDSRRQAEAELAGREKRVRNLDIRPLDPSARASYQARWTTIQQQFVDQPAAAVSDAQQLITAVMADRGYPTEDVDQIMADLSVDHAATLGHFRTAQDIAGRVTDGTASTEDLRQAMIHYRLLFEELLGEQHDPTQPVPAVTDPAESGVPVSAADADAVAFAEPAADPVVADPAQSSLAESSLAEPTVTQPDGDLPGELAPAADEAAWDSEDRSAEPAAASRRPWRR